MTIGVDEQIDTELYDYTDTTQGLYDLELNDGLSEREIQEATWMAERGLTRGVWLVTGAPGAGKGLFGIVMNWKIRRYFKGKRSILDYKPTPLFDEGADEQYTFFNSNLMLQELDKMALKAGVNIHSNNGQGKHLNEASELSKNWVKGKGEILLRSGVWSLDELKRYVDKRRPMAVINVMTGNIITVWRHLDLLVLGMTPFKNEIDEFRYIQYVTHWVKCSWSKVQPDTADCRIYRARYVGSSGVFEVVGKPITVHINGGKPREELGGKRYFDLYVSKDTKNLKPAMRVRM